MDNYIAISTLNDFVIGMLVWCIFEADLGLYISCALKKALTFIYLHYIGF